MDRSETIGTLAAALAKAQGAMTAAKKDADNPFFKSRYADLAAVVEAVRVPLSTNGLAYVQTVDTSDEGDVIIETILMHSSGEWISSRLGMTPVKKDPQGIGSVITYARRYGLQSMLGVPADDDDGNAASGNSNGNTTKVTPAKADPKPAPSTMRPVRTTEETQYEERIRETVNNDLKWDTTKFIVTLKERYKKDRLNLLPLADLKNLWEYVSKEAELKKLGLQESNEEAPDEINPPEDDEAPTLEEPPVYDPKAQELIDYIKAGWQNLGRSEENLHSTIVKDYQADDLAYMGIKDLEHLKARIDRAANAKPKAS